MQLTPAEQSLGKMAAAVVQAAGGEVTFEEYDRLMLPKRYFTPLNWIAGWGLSYARKKANDDKLCAFAAVKMGLLIQSDTGYALTDSPPVNLPPTPTRGGD